MHLAAEYFEHAARAYARLGTLLLVLGAGVLVLHHGAFDSIGWFLVLLFPESAAACFFITVRCWRTARAARASITEFEAAHQSQATA